MSHRFAQTAMFTLIMASSAAGQSPVIDGRFGDWQGEHVISTDPAGDASASFDITEVSAITQGTTLFLRFDIGEKINLQSGRKECGTLTMLCDLHGREQLKIDFRQRTAVFMSAPDERIAWSQLGFVCLPSYASTQYELMIDLSLLGLQGGEEIRINFGESDALSEPAMITLGEQRPPTPEFSLDKSSSGDVRLVNLNTFQQGLSDPQRVDGLRRLLTASQADIYCFQEEWQEGRFRRAAQRLIPTRDDQRLSLHSNNGCGIATTLPLQPLPMNLDRGSSAAIGLPDDRHLVVFSVHLKCCGFAGSREDRIRIDQTQQIADRIQRLRLGEYGKTLRQAGVIVIGDYNLVGSRRPLDVLSSVGLTDWVLLQPGGKTAFTWRGMLPIESYWPGRLDLLTFDKARLIPRKGLVLDTAGLNGEALTQYQLQSDDSRASDHLMLIADFQFVPPTQ